MTFAWLSGTSGAWENGDNWSPTGVPGATDDALITAPGVYLVTLGTVAVNDLTLDNSDVVLQAFGSLTVNNDLVVTAGTLLAQEGLTATDFTNTGVVTVSSTLEILGSYDTESLNQATVTALMPVWPFVPESGGGDALLSSARLWGVDLLVEALRVEEDDDPTPAPSVRDRLRRWADAAGHGGRLKATRLPGRDGCYVVFASAAPA